MKKIIFPIIGLSLLAGGCELFEVTNPYVTEERFINTSDAAKTWVNGSRREMSTTVGTLSEFTELVSDNYFNNYTQSSKVFDIPQLDYFDVDVTNIQRTLHRLLENVKFGLEKVLPADGESTSEQRAELLMYKGYTHILCAEFFVGMPASELGEVLSPVQHLDLAISDLSEAENIFAEQADKLTCALLKARAFYRLGNPSAATTEARKVLELPLLNRQVFFGTQTGPANNLQNAIFSSTTNQFAPLPRLDFLDPKYFNLTPVVADDQKPISIAKAEEAYLIIAEAEASAGNSAAAKNILRELLDESVFKRPTVQLDDSRDTRNGGNRNDYPLTALKVKFDESSTPRDNYIVDRQAGEITAYLVSGTKVTHTDIDNADSQEELLYLIYLLRQEIFFGEGRRMADLGIRFPVSQLEEQNNPNVRTEHTKAIIPAFIPLNREMDDFTVDLVNGVVTMKHDINKVLVDNRSSGEIMPFIN